MYISYITFWKFTWITTINNKKRRTIIYLGNIFQSIFSIISKLHGTILLGEETFFNGSSGVYGGFGQKESLQYPFWATRIKNTSR